MSALDEEQQAALRKFKHDVLGVAPDVASVVGVAVPEPKQSGRQQRPTPPKSAKGKARPKSVRPSVLFGDILRETRLPLQELVRESRFAGIQLDPMPRQTRLFEEEAEYLRRLAALKASQPRLTERTYKPDPEGHISLEDYDRLDQEYAEKLLAWDYIPTRKELKSFPNRSWAGIVRHHRRLETLRTKLERESATLQRRNGTPVGSRSSSEFPMTTRSAVEARPVKAPATAVSSPLLWHKSNANSTPAGTGEKSTPNPSP